MPESPYLTIDLDRVRENLHTLRAALPDATIRYAVEGESGRTDSAATRGRRSHLRRRLDRRDRRLRFRRHRRPSRDIRKHPQKHAQTAAAAARRGPPVHFDTEQA